MYDVSKHDTEVDGKIELVTLTSDQKRMIKKDKILKELPPCMSRVLTKTHVGWRDRFLIISYLRDKGYMNAEVTEILRKFLSKRDFRHCTQEECSGYKNGTVGNLFRSSYLFPNCESLRYEGYCLFKKDCPDSGRLYK